MAALRVLSLTILSDDPRHDKFLVFRFAKCPNRRRGFVAPERRPEENGPAWQALLCGLLPGEAKKGGMTRDMTDKQRAFVMEYMVDLNATQAAVRAGYSPNRADSTGSHLLANPSVREAVDNAMAELAEKTGRTALDVLRDIQELTREAREEGDVKTALKGLELEGKHLGMFTGKVENHVSGEVMVQWKQS